MAVSRRSNWNVVCGDLESVVDLVLEEGASGDSHPASVVLEAAPDSGSCEISVEFHKHSCTVQGISIISSARQCEVYSLLDPQGDAEYVGTARGEAYDETIEEIPLYEAEVELVDSEPWMGIKVRLLSLVNRSRVDLIKLTIVAAVGPVVSKQEETGSLNNANLLKMMMPSVLDMLRGMPSRNHKIETVPSKPNEIVSGVQEGASSSSSVKKQLTLQVEREEEDKSFRKEVVSKLQGLEAAVGGIELFLREAFRKVDGRLETLEKQMYEIQAQKAAAFENVDIGRLESRASVLSTTTTDVCTPAPSAAGEVSEAGDLEPPRKISLSLENAWSSSLAAFSTSAAAMKMDDFQEKLPDGTTGEITSPRMINEVLRDEDDEAEAVSDEAVVPPSSEPFEAGTRVEPDQLEATSSESVVWQCRDPPATKVEADEAEDEKVEADEAEDEKVEPDEAEDEKVEPDEGKDEKVEPDEGEDEKVEPDEGEDEKVEPDEAQAETDEGVVVHKTSVEAAQTDENEPGIQDEAKSGVASESVVQGDDGLMNSGATGADNFDLIDWSSSEDAAMPAAAAAAAAEAQTLKNSEVFSLIDLPAEAGHHVV